MRGFLLWSFCWIFKQSKFQNWEEYTLHKYCTFNTNGEKSPLWFTSAWNSTRIHVNSQQYGTFEQFHLNHVDVMLLSRLIEVKSESRYFQTWFEGKFQTVVVFSVLFVFHAVESLSPQRAELDLLPSQTAPTSPLFMQLHINLMTVLSTLLSVLTLIDSHRYWLISRIY